ncbi:MAG: NFACT family protein [Clostridia bacterium]|nr:NFACT family protein [Clostridia bacterium]
MPQDAFTLKYIARELKECFTGGKISKINQPAKDLLSLLIYTRNGTLKLDIDLSAKYCRISAGERTETPNPKVAPNFCMLLRKHLQNAEITEISQVDFERIIRIDFKCFSEFEIAELQLYLEIMGKYSNAILVKDGIILGALKTASLETGARRVMMSGAKYLLPEKQDKADPTNLEELEKAFGAKCGDAAEFIANRVAGIAFVTAADIVAEYGENISAKQLYGYVNDPSYTPCLILRDGEPCDFKARKTANASQRKTLLEAQAEFYGYAVRKKAFADKKRRLVSAVNSAQKKVEKQLAQTYEKLSECDKSEEIKLKGELITANIYAIERGLSSFEAVNYYDENCGKITVELDPRLTPSQNAQKYYKRYQKLKRTATTLNARKTESEAKRQYLNSISANLELAETPEDLIETEEELISLSLLPAPKAEGKKGNKKAAPENPFRTYEFEGVKIVCGRNNAQNDRLTKGLAPTDIWLHVKSFHSSHVAILTQGKEASDGAVKLAAEVCAYYSDARGKDKVAVDYTQKKYVKKPNGANLGFAVYTDYKTITVTPNAHTEERSDERE